MPIIVDDIFQVVPSQYHGADAALVAQATRVGARNGHRWSHLSSTPDDDPDFTKLHAFARRIGMQRAWFQGDHYDVTPGRRAQAVRYGAFEVTRLELSMVLLYDRKGRERPTYGTPDKTTHEYMNAR